MITEEVEGEHKKRSYVNDGPPCFSLLIPPNTYHFCFLLDHVLEW